MSKSNLITKKSILIISIFLVLIIHIEKNLIFEFMVDELADVQSVTTDIQPISAESLITNGFDGDESTIFHSALHQNKGNIYIDVNESVINAIGFSPQLFYTTRLPEKLELYGIKNNKLILIYKHTLKYKRITQGEYHFFNFANDTSYERFMISMSTNDLYLTFSEIALVNGNYSYSLRHGLIFYISLLILSIFGLARYVK